MRAYSLDLRERIVRAVDEGRSQREAARLFGVGVSTVKRYVQQRARTGHLARRPIPGAQPKIGPEPAATLAELGQWWAAEQGHSGHVLSWVASTAWASGSQTKPRLPICHNRFSHCGRACATWRVGVARACSLPVDGRSWPVAAPSGSQASRFDRHEEQGRSHTPWQRDSGGNRPDIERRRSDSIPLSGPDRRGSHRANTRSASTSPSHVS